MVPFLGAKNRQETWKPFLSRALKLDLAEAEPIACCRCDTAAAAASVQFGEIAHMNMRHTNYSAKAKESIGTLTM